GAPLRVERFFFAREDFPRRWGRHTWTEGGEMSQLEKLIENHNEIRWTEEEIADWISRLSAEKRNLVLDGLKRAQRGGLDLHRLACQMRERSEQIERKNRPAWYDIWSEASIGWTLGGII